MEFSVLVETKALEGEAMDDDKVIELLGDLTERLSATENVDGVSRGHVAGGDGRGWSVRLTTWATRASRAVDIGTDVIWKAADEVGLPLWPIIRTEAVEVGELEAELATSNFPDIVGSNEAAEILGVTRQRLHTLRDKPDFPRPMVRLAATDVWLRGAIEAFNERWERRPGRPPSTPMEILADNEDLERELEGEAEAVSAAENAGRDFGRTLMTEVVEPICLPIARWMTRTIARWPWLHRKLK